MRIRAFLSAGLLACTACVLGAPSGDLHLEGLSVTKSASAAVLPFSGSDGYPRVTADWIAFRLAERGLSVSTAEQSALALRDANLAWPEGGDPAPERVRAVAALLHADFLLTGRTAPRDEFQRQSPADAVSLSVWDGASGRLAGRTVAVPPPVMTTSGYTVLKVSADHAADCVLRGLGILPPEPPQGE